MAGKATDHLANMLPLATGGKHEHFRTASQGLWMLWLNLCAGGAYSRRVGKTSLRLPATTFLAFENHFIAGRHGEDGVQLNLSHRTHTWTSFVEQENPIGHCLSRDSEAGMLSIDTSLLDCVVRVELLSDGERACVPDCQGGKLVETSAVEMIETWQGSSVPGAAVLAIAQPYPIRFTTSPFSDGLLEDDHEANSESDCASVSSSGSRRFEAPSDVNAPSVSGQCQ